MTVRELLVKLLDYDLDAEVVTWNEKVSIYTTILDTWEGPNQVRLTRY